jgi:hypothetical protein
MNLSWTGKGRYDPDICDYISKVPTFDVGSVRTPSSLWNSLTNIFVWYDAHPNADMAMISNFMACDAVASVLCPPAIAGEVPLGEELEAAAQREAQQSNAWVALQAAV